MNQNETYALTIVIPNKDRLDFNKSSSQWWLKSLLWQDYINFKILIVDGCSSNYEEYKQYLDKYDKKIQVDVIQHAIDKENFHKTLLNNVGIKYSKTHYIMLTDADMLFAKDFVKTLMEHVDNNCLVESRTLYWKQNIANKIYSGELDPYMDIESCKIGRIKYRTSPGGCQCMDIDSWNKIRGYDERYKGWGSEDMDLVLRASKANIKIKWLGESRDTIMIFHQPHDKKDISKDLECQEKNKKFLHDISDYRANVGLDWGGTSDNG